MGTAGFIDIDQAKELVRSAMDAVFKLRDGAFWKIGGGDLLTLGQELEGLNRAVYGVNVHLAGEIDTQTLAKQRSCSSTATLLRQALLISPAEASGRVNAARAVLPQEALTGGEIDPVLPALATALDTGALGSEHVKTIVATMKKLPTQMLEADRNWWESFLVEHAAKLNPRDLQDIAKAVLDAADPDGTLDESDVRSRMELHFGTRNIRTGLTGITGQLDDHGLEVIRKAIDGLSTPSPAADGTPDHRSPANRSAHALVAAAEGFLAAGTAPSNGGEKPQVASTSTGISSPARSARQPANTASR